MGSETVEDTGLKVVREGVAEKGKTFEELSEAERAEYIPFGIFNLKRNEPALMFSRKDLLTIKRYEAAVRRLPQRGDERYKKTFEVLGLTIDDVDNYFDNLRRHVDSWDHIEDLCKSVGNDLQVFAEELLVSGGEFINYLKTMEAWESIYDNAETLPDLPLSSADVKTFQQGVDIYLVALKDDIEDKLKGIAQVKKLVDHFARDIKNNLKSEAEGLENRLLEKSIPGTLDTLVSELKGVDEEIERKRIEYNGLVGSAFYGLVFGPFGLAITGGIYGPQAEAVRKEKNGLIEKRQELNEKVQVLSSDVGDFLYLTTSMTDIRFRLVGVEKGAKNLEDAWGLMHAYASDSLKKASRLETQFAVKKFIAGFERIVRPWNSILEISRDMSHLFNETVSEFN